MDGCVHHWVFPTPNGTWVTGVCKKCAAVSEPHRSGLANDYDDYNAERKKLKTEITPKAEVSHVFARMESERQAQTRGGKA